MTEQTPNIPTDVEIVFDAGNWPLYAALAFLAGIATMYVVALLMARSVIEVPDES